MPTPEKHAVLSASSAHRWLRCTAAPRFEENFPNTTSEYAAEGTLAHAICELKLLKKFTPMSPKTYTTRYNKLKKNERYKDEMDRTSDAYIEYLVDTAMSYDSIPSVSAEVRVDFTEYVPDGFGTCDCIMLGGTVLNIVDYKHGQGKVVSAIGNEQMRLYALGALKRYRMIYGDTIKTVRMTIFQPRVTLDPSVETITVDELIAWGNSIKPIAQRAYAGFGEFVPGDHCQFCRGRAQCRARADMNTAFEEFKDFAIEGKAAPELLALDDAGRRALDLPPMLSDAEIGDLLERAETLVQWYSDLKGYATEAILSGKDVQGWKVVAGKSNRVFTDTDAAFAAVKGAGYDEALLYERKPITLTAVEKLLGKTAFNKLLSGFVVKPIGKPTLAKMSDPREPYSAAASDFAGVAYG